MISAALAGGFSLLAAAAASAGPVSDQFRSGAFGVPWTAGKAAIEAKHPGGKWDADDTGRARYCAASRQSLLKLPPQHQTREICFLMGSDGTLGSATARMDASLPTLLAVVNRSRTMFGDFDAVRRDESSIQSRSTAMLWMKDSPYLVQVASANDTSGSPVEVTFTVADEASLHTGGAERVSHRPAGQ
ncbi:MAG TPA: hypothetical protein VLH36_01820 [Steroidobacteraceae bacterium]|nr:hypothetical protein [Steroidobacteraceae bacterium]